MIFAEYIERDRAMPLEIFRHHGRQDWVSDEDVMVANLGRTMRLAPVPHYMCWWKIASIARMDAWEAHFRTPAGQLYAAHTPVSRALNFTRCGLYDEIVGDGTPVPPGLHLVEFFTADGVSPAELGRHFERRAAAATAGRLVYVINRLGLLAPDPGGMALWSFDSYVAAEPFLRARHDHGPAPVVEAGLYRNFGDDIA
jgi:hypothetical protein